MPCSESIVGYLYYFSLYSLVNIFWYVEELLFSVDFLEMMMKSIFGFKTFISYLR